MAGGKLANHVPCLVCLSSGQVTQATRTYEGLEDDRYRCDHGHEFGMDWSKGEATEPLWPPSPELQAFAASQAKEGGR